MLRSLCGIVVIVIAVLLTGCGGGGGVSTTGGNSIVSTVPTTQQVVTLPTDLTGNWTVKNLGLPNNEIIVESDGSVNVVSSGTRSSSKIGSCSTEGILTLNGGWSVDSKSYTIMAAGRINTTSSSLSLNATLLESGKVVVENAAVQGDRSSGYENLPGPNDAFDAPPAPPFTVGSNAASSSNNDVPTPPSPPTFN